MGSPLPQHVEIDVFVGKAEVDAIHDFGNGRFVHSHFVVSVDLLIIVHIPELHIAYPRIGKMWIIVKFFLCMENADCLIHQIHIVLCAYGFACAALPCKCLFRFINVIDGSVAV